MTIAYAPEESRYLSYIKQISRAALMDGIISWKEIDHFESDVIKNEMGMNGLSLESKRLIQKVERFIETITQKVG